MSAMFSSDEIYDKINDLTRSRTKRQVCKDFTIYSWSSRKWEYKVVPYAGDICMYQLFHKGVMIFEEVEAGNETRSLYFNSDHVSDGEV